MSCVCRYCGKAIKKAGKRTICGSCCVTRRRWKSKIELVNLLGGKCEDCGYCGHPAALQFHHRDPKEKSFELSSNKLLIKERYEEVKKCKLLCANCHAIYHVSETAVTKSYLDGLFKSPEPVHSRDSKKPSKEDLSKAVSEMPLNRVAKQYSVSDNCIKRWCKEYSIPESDLWAKKSGYNYRAESGVKPSKEDLIALVTTKSLTQIGRELGVSTSTVKFWCKKYGIHSSEFYWNRKT